MSVVLIVALVAVAAAVVVYFVWPRGRAAEKAALATVEADVAKVEARFKPASKSAAPAVKSFPDPEPPVAPPAAS